MWGDPVECWQVAEFYRGVNIEADTDYCKSARTMNYICGCEDTSGYGGANSEAKRMALAWIPRVGAILSILVRGSLCQNFSFCLFGLVTSNDVCLFLNFFPLATFFLLLFLNNFFKSTFKTILIFVVEIERGRL